MPFRSESQRKFLWAKHPDIAERWAYEFPDQKNLPKHVRKEVMLSPEIMAAFVKEAAGKEFAPGIPVGKPTHPLPTFSSPKVWRFIQQFHPAVKSGDHFDLRIIDPDTTHAYSWATRKELPLPGAMISVFEQPTHTEEYARYFSGPIVGGYGATKPGKGVKKTIDHPIEVLQSDPDFLRFNAYHGKGPQEYVLARDKKSPKTWLLMNTTKTRDSLHDLPFSKPRYREVKPEAIDMSDARQVMAVKLDGAHCTYKLEAGKRPRIYSYREPKERTTGAIEHSHKVEALYNSTVPKELGHTVLRGELYARTPDGKAPVPANLVAGMLNSDVWKSRDSQARHGKLRAAIFDVVTFRGKDMTGATYREKIEALKAVKKHMPQFETPEMAFTEDEKKALFSAIKGKTHAASGEGVILWQVDEAAPPTKAKFKDEHDVFIREIFPAIDKNGKEKDEAGGFAYSHTEDGPVVGRVGTGFTRTQKRDMLRNKKSYIGAVAKVHAMSKYPSGALEKPAFKGFHLDKNDPEVLAKLASVLTPMLSREKRQALARADAFFGEEDKTKKWSQFDEEVARKSFAKSLAKDPRSDEKLALHADRMNRLKMGKTLAQIKGTKGTYDIKRLRGGGLGCTCGDWRFKKSVAPEGETDCKHIEKWRIEGAKKEAADERTETLSAMHDAIRTFCAERGIDPKKALVIAGGASYAHGLRNEVNDLDIVHPDLPAKVKQQIGRFEMDAGPGGHLPPDSLDAMQVGNLRVQTPEAMVAIYKHFNRPKDQGKIDALLAYISGKKRPKKEAALVEGTRLQPHQQDLLERSRKSTGILAHHSLGAGKSLSSLAIGEDRGGNVLVVTPASLRENYQGQLRQFVTPDRHKNYYIMSYEKFKKDPEGYIERIKPNTLVVDEVHRLRNSAPRQAFAKVREKIPFMLGLTGSIINNRPEELVQLTNLVAGKKLYTDEEFARKHIRQRKVNPGFVGRAMGVEPGIVEEGRNLKEMAARLSPHIHRFSGSKEYSKNIPKVTESEVRVPMSPEQERIYRGVEGSNPILAYKVKKNLPPSKKELENMNAFMSALRQVSNDSSGYDPSLRKGHSPKMKAMLADIKAKAKDDPNFRSVIYSNFLGSGVSPLVDQLNTSGISSEAFTGKLTDKKRKDLIERYNAGKVKVLGLSPAGGEGLDLKGTKLVQLVEEHWNPERGIQAIGRSARFKSHEHLPEGERNVEVKRYFATHAPKWHHRFIGKPETGADEWINARRQEKLKLNKQFIDALPSFSREDE